MPLAYSLFHTAFRSYICYEEYLTFVTATLRRTLTSQVVYLRPTDLICSHIIITVHFGISHCIIADGLSRTGWIWDSRRGNLRCKMRRGEFYDEKILVDAWARLRNLLQKNCESRIHTEQLMIVKPRDPPLLETSYFSGEKNMTRVSYISIFSTHLIWYPIFPAFLPYI